MAALAPSVAAIRAAVRRALPPEAARKALPPEAARKALPPEAVRKALPPEAVRKALPPEGSVLVACSGGADSLALAAAVAFVARGTRPAGAAGIGPGVAPGAGLVTVDHGLQPGSAERASDVAEWARGQGFDPVEVATVDVAGRRGGPEAAARDARYAALVAAARAHGATTVLLGHTKDDQAETVLLALARGAGPRGLAGMPARRTVDGVILLRPLLGISRAQTREACAVLGLKPWDDPHNADPAYARARVRDVALPALVAALGPGVVDNLARTAEMLAADTEALDALAGAVERDPDGSLAVSTLVALPAALRTRVLRAWVRDLGVPGGALSHGHIVALDALVVGWHGQGPAHLPGGVTVARYSGRLVCTTKV